MKKRSFSQFQPIIHDKKIELSFIESFPVILNAFESVDSDLVSELDSFILSIQNLDLIKKEKKYNMLKIQNVDESHHVSFNFDLKNGIEKINKVLNLFDGKKTYLIPSNVPKIINVDRSVFRIIDNIDELIE